MVEYSCTNPKVPGSIPARSHTRFMHVKCILLLQWSTSSQRLWVFRISVPNVQKDPRFLFKKRRGQPQEFWYLVSAIDSTLYPRTVWKNSYAEHERTIKKQSSMLQRGSDVVFGGISFDIHSRIIPFKNVIHTPRGNPD